MHLRRRRTPNGGRRKNFRTAGIHLAKIEERDGEIHCFQAFCPLTNLLIYAAPIVSIKSAGQSEGKQGRTWRHSRLNCFGASCYTYRSGNTAQQFYHGNAKNAMIRFCSLKRDFDRRCIRQNCCRSRLAGYIRKIVDIALCGFLGWRMQCPPNISAVHVDGERAHVLARSGQIPDIV